MMSIGVDNFVLLAFVHPMKLKIHFALTLSNDIAPKCKI